MPIREVKDAAGKVTGHAMVCVRYEPGYGPCAFCGAAGRLLCDMSLGNGRTCDARICESCTTRPKASIETDFCPIHKHKGVKDEQSGF